MDETLPLDASELCLPDVGAMVASVAKATTRQVDVVCGKPSPLAFELIRAEHDGVEAESSGKGTQGISENFIFEVKLEQI